MKRLLFIVLIGITANASLAQYPKWLIRFTDKSNSPYTIDNPSQYLSAKGVERRTRYSLTVDSSDMPINPSYIDSVLARGNINFLSASKWLNQILVECTDQAAINAVKKLPFVITVNGIGKRVINKNRERFSETTAVTGSTQKTQTTADDYFSYGSSYNQVYIHNGEFLHNKGFHGETITIAMLDAGFNSYKTTGAFDSSRLNGKILGEKDFVDFDNSVNEDDTHGAYCLSTIAANWPGKMIGTAPAASFWLLRSENAGSEYPIEEHNWVVAAEYADSAGADMISSSLGYYDFDDTQFDHSYNDFYKNSTMVSKGAAYACKKGMIVMNSAGNEGNNNWKYLIFPADADSVCTVGAVDGNGQIASFSSYGYQGKVKPNVVSIGAGTAVASPGGVVYGSGTSFSNPNMAGLVACLWQAFPQYNNMAILNALYKSADRYNAPDNRYGYGIPNMKTAYRLLKHQQNIELFGNDWFWVTPAIFTNQIDARFTGRVDSTATLELLNDQGTVLATKNFITEIEEVYNYAFTALDNLPGGNYTVRYTDNTGTRSIAVKKNGPAFTDWVLAAPNPFNEQLIIYIKPKETGKTSVRLINTSGKIIETVELNVTANLQYSISFTKAWSLAAGVYFVECINNQQKKTLKVVK